MAVKVRFSSNVKQLVGKDELALRLDPSKTYTIRDILEEITRLENKELSIMLIEEEGRTRGTVRVVVNGREIHYLEGLETKIRDGDSIAYFRYWQEDRMSFFIYKRVRPCVW